MQPDTTLQVSKTDLSDLRLITNDPRPLKDGEISVSVERFGLTANNITYGVVGERIGYWRFFPTGSSDWGVIPVWGVGVVEESTRDDIATGERLYGYWPMGNRVHLCPDRVDRERYFDASEHRSDLPGVYNRYLRLSNEPGYDPSGDDLRMVLWPLFATSFCLYDFALDNDWFGAEQVVIGSASSKTGIGTGYAFKDDPAAPPVFGLTSIGNADNVRALRLYDDVILYDDIEEKLDAGRKTLIIDMSGSGKVIDRLHKHLGDAMVFTSHVGITHYSEAGMGPNYVADRSEMFFAPGHIAKRGKDWGPGEFERRSGDFWKGAAEASKRWLTLSHASGAKAAENAYREVLEGRTAADRAWTVSLTD
jgi:Protein of unknown function (DUF2855)